MTAERIANYCSRCGHALEQRERFGKLRPVCPQCGQTVFFDPKVAVVVFITDGDRVLLVQRMHPPAQGLWALPAGFVDADEDPAAAAVREAQEETGMIVEVDALLDVLHRPDPDGLADIIIAYSAHVTGGVLCAADDACDARWFARDALPEVGLVTTLKLLDGWAQNEINPK